MRQRGGSEQPVKGRRANRSKAHKVSTAAPSVADLQSQVGSLTRELKEANERQTATVEILQVINSSPGDLAPVFDAILQKAHSLCGVTQGSLQLYDGAKWRAVAMHGLSEAFADQLRQGIVPGPNHPSQPLLKGARFAHVPNLGAIDDPISRTGFDLAGIRTILFIPLRKEGALLGRISAARQEVKPFTEKEIGLLESFAAQAVIAIENARLFNELKQRTTDLSESLQQQTATADVLKVISRSAFDLQKVFDALTESACRVCGAYDAGLLLREAEFLRVRSHHGPIPMEFDTTRISRDWVNGRSVVDRKSVHVHDLQAEAGEFPVGCQMARRMGLRTILAVPLVREQEVVGSLVLRRTEVLPFSEKQISLAETFADQAVIAIENARLFDEVQAKTRDLEESLQQQTATADVLKVISRSAFDLRTVLDALLGSACRLCEADIGTMRYREGSDYRLAATFGFKPEWIDHFSRYSTKPDRGSIFGRTIVDGRTTHIPDVLADPDWQRQSAQKLMGIRAALGVPLVRDGQTFGVISLFRLVAGSFSEKQIELVETFADQAVIAIQNVKLFDEVQTKTRDLEESLQQQTATADVLKVISRSSVELKTVLETLVETVARLCRGDQTSMYRRHEDDKHHLVAAWGFSEEAKQFVLANPLSPGRGTVTGHVILERRAVHMPDVLQDRDYTYREGQKVVGYRTLLGIPLLREDSLIGVFLIARTRVEPFTDREIELATTFADQAVIAIENARLFEELRDRQAELRVTFDNMGDGVVMFGADTRLVAWNRNFQEMLELPDAFLAGRPSFADYFRYLADRGEYVSADLEAQLGRTVDDTRLEQRFERTRPDGRVVEVRRNPVPGGAFVLIYSDITERKRAEEAIRAARDAAETALRELQTAQASLVHAQKMAALGQLTAGIAHEIKNPLNFVNNFAGLSVELLDELKEAARAVGTLDPHKRAEIVETIGMLTGNLQKIVEHGRRADGIVRSMLQHSRGGSDDWQPTDLNALAEEALNLAYHGARAQDPNFNITLERDLDLNLAPVDVVPQELTRVLLNLIGNGFYAANERGRKGDGAQRPALKVTTRELGESVEVRVRDNGIGIPPEHRDKLFQPFFTTKPTGEGTGLGLSISYEIVAQQHGGTITVDSEVGDFTEFTVRLPRRRHALAGRMG